MKRRLFGCLVLTGVIWCLISGMAGIKGVSPVVSDNVGAQNYDGGTARPVRSYLIAGRGGFMTRVEYVEDRITVEEYNGAGQILTQKDLPVELDLFGGFYAGDTDYFFVFGQENPQEDDSREVIRVVRYTKDWQRVDDARLLGANTVRPFYEGSLRMVQSGDMLYIRTAHQMYQSRQDGLSHQANLTFSIQIPSMEITDQHSAVTNYGFGYVSRSTNQFLALHGKTLVAADQGDAYPRAVVLFQCARPAGESSFSGYATAVEVLPISGAPGDPVTGVSIGGLEATTAACLVAGCAVEPEGEGARTGGRAIFVTSTPWDAFTQEATEIHWMTDGTSETPVSNPQLVRLADDRLLLMWTAQEQLQYCFLDATGKMQGRVYRADAQLSDCKPVVLDDCVWWYCTADSAPIFYKLDPASPDRVERFNGNLTVTLDPQGGSVSPEAIAATYGEPYGFLPTPVRLDYAFQGWYLDQGAVQTLVTAETRVTVGQDHTLYAKWTSAPHSHTYEKTVTPPTCVEKGYTTYVCTLCGSSYTEEFTEALGHCYDAVVWIQEPTCTEPGLCRLTCARCGQSQTQEVAAVGHAYDEGTVVQEPSCTASGLRTYTCARCGDRWTETLAPLPHSYGAVAVPPTCTEAGYTMYTCAVCGDTYRDGNREPLGHSWDHGRVTVPPTETHPGIRTYLCTRCGENRTEEIAPWSHPFVDLQSDRFYYTSVLWAYSAGITDGVDPTHFAPDRACTRGQVVTFLWRAYGCPEPSSDRCPFQDVSDRRYYHQAVLWAAEAGIALGTDATHFSPDATVTRGQFVTFLWRAEGSPTASGGNPFVDVEKGRFYYDAVLWAASEDITAGVDAVHFAPGRSCTRGQVATFLYRSFNQ